MHNKKAVSPKWNIGDMVELKNCHITNAWFAGSGIIVAIEDGHYHIMTFQITKTTEKNFAEFQLNPQIYKFSIDACDNQDCFKSLEY